MFRGAGPRGDDEAACSPYGKERVSVPRSRVTRSGRRDVEANSALALEDVCHRDALVTSPVHVVWGADPGGDEEVACAVYGKENISVALSRGTRSRRGGSEPIRCSSLVVSERGLLPVRTQLPTETSAHSRDIGARAEKKSGVPLMPSAKKNSLP